MEIVNNILEFFSEIMLKYFLPFFNILIILMVIGLIVIVYYHITHF